MPLFKINQGSVLVFSLIILSIILSAAITVATVSVTNQRSATATGKSVQSFQVADSGIELALQKIYKGTYTSSDSLATAMTGMTCSGTTLTKSDVAGGTVSLTLFDTDGNPINCSDTSWRDKVVKVKSEGSAFGTTRVVETAVAASIIKVASDIETTGFALSGGRWCKTVDYSSAGFTSIPKIIVSISDTGYRDPRGTPSYDSDRTQVIYSSATTTDFRLCCSSSSHASNLYDLQCSAYWMAIQP